MNGQEQYRMLARQCPLPVFAQPWWLDITAGTKRWDAVIVAAENGTTEGLWPFAVKKQMGFTRIFMPPYTPYLGPQLLYPANLSPYERRSFEHKVLGKLIQLLPENRDARFKWSYTYDNWLPFYWAGFEQTTRYTYLCPANDASEQWGRLKDSVKRQINKAQGCIEIVESTDVSQAIRLYQSSLQEKETVSILQKDLLLQLHHAVVDRHCGVVLEARKGAQVIAAIFLVWDQQQMYYLFGGQDAVHKDSGAKTYLFWKAIQLAGQKGLEFNFEGSMLPGVERFFRSFGALLTPVHFIHKRRYPFTMVPL